MERKHGMEPNIMIISPSEYFYEVMTAVMREYGYEFPIVVATGDEAVRTAKELDENKAPIIITRGRNVNRLREEVNVAVVEVNYTYEDIYRSYQEARQMSDKIAFFGLDQAYEMGCKFKEISGEPLLIPNIQTTRDIEGVINKVIREAGVGCLIGGDTVKAVAQKQQMPYVNTYVTPVSVRRAIEEAVKLHNITMERRRVNWVMNSILETAGSGIIAIDEKRQLLHINQRAKYLLKDQEQTFLNQFLQQPAIADVLSENGRIRDYIYEFDSVTLNLDCEPIALEDAFAGYTITLRDAEEIITAETEIRRKMITKSRRAKKTFMDIVGASPLIKEAIDKAKRYARSDSTILLTGESGTGKEIFSQSIHNYSDRKDKPFVAINCAAIAENILESELFGYVKGAFTGARAEGKAGVFEQAHTGTIFLDEIGEISKNMQVKLLRVLQEREITRIGDTKTTPIDVRVIAATNRDLPKRVKKNKFRMDLFYRLCVLELQLPPLRKRKEDVPALIQMMLTEYPQMPLIGKTSLALLSTYDYPGNIRQLQNILERLVVMSDDNFISEEMTRKVLDQEPDLNERKTKKVPKQPQAAGGTGIVEAEKKLILETLAACNGNKAATCEALGISKTTLWRKLKEYEN